VNSHGADPVSWFLIEPGWQVADVAGAELGTVHEVRGDENEDIFDGLVVATSPLDKKYVPSEVVGPITEGRIELTVSADQVGELS
jgi:hypothetical protein